MDQAVNFSRRKKYIHIDEVQRVPSEDNGTTPLSQGRLITVFNIRESERRVNKKLTHFRIREMEAWPAVTRGIMSLSDANLLFGIKINAN